MESTLKISKWARLLIVSGIMCLFFVVLNKIFNTYNFGQATLQGIGTAFAFTFVGLIVFLDVVWDSVWDDSIVAEKLGLKDMHSQLAKGIILFGTTFAITYFATVLISGVAAGPEILIVAIFISSYVAYPETGDDYVLLGAWIGIVATGIVLGWFTPMEWVGAQTGIFNIFKDLVP